MAYTTLNKMVTVLINNILSVIVVVVVLVVVVVIISIYTNIVTVFRRMYRRAVSVVVGLTKYHGGHVPLPGRRLLATDFFNHFLHAVQILNHSPVITQLTHSSTHHRHHTRDTSAINRLQFVARVPCISVTSGIRPGTRFRH